MLEVEVKASVRDVEALRRRLRAAGGRRVGAERERDAYFAHPGRDFRATDEALRVRTRTPRGGRATRELTYKGPKFDARTKSRVERTLPDPRGEAAALVAALGFAASRTVEKQRETWRVGPHTVAVDRVDGLGDFVEVERVVDAAPGSAAFRRARDGCLRLLRDLGAGRAERRSYLELLEPRRGAASGKR